MDQLMTACTFLALSFVSTPVKSVASLSYTSLARISMPKVGASFSSFLAALAETSVAGDHADFGLSRAFHGLEKSG